MIAVSTTELSKNLQKYLDMAKKERVIIQCGNAETYEIILAEKISDTDQYFADPEVINRIKHSVRQVKKGKTHILPKSEIKNLLGLE